MPNGLAPHNLNRIGEACGKASSLNFHNRMNGITWRIAVLCEIRTDENHGQHVELEYALEDVEDEC